MKPIRLQCLKAQRTFSGKVIEKGVKIFKNETEMGEIAVVTVRERVDEWLPITPEIINKCQIFYYFD